MPIYEYECNACRLVFEKIRKVTGESEGILCPSCGSENPRKLVTNFRTNAWSTFLDAMERKVNPHKFKE